MQASLVTDVADTARWVAASRAVESARPDALFHDDLAARLAGEHGRAIDLRSSRFTRGGWPVVARTRLIDDLVLACVAEGCDRVINLAAGLDTRPYRLQLPAALRWLEADLAGLVEEKSRLLASENPRCSVQRASIDLTDQPARGAFLDEALDGAKQALVITEGLLTYLSDADVRALAADLARRSTIGWWVLDINAPRLMRFMNSSMKEFARAPLRFAPPEGVAFFEALGFSALEVWSLFHAAARFKRLPWMLLPLALMPEPNPRRVLGRLWSGITRLRRSAP